MLCCPVLGRGLCDGLITRPEESYRVSVCVWSRNPEKGGQRSFLDYKLLWMNELMFKQIIQSWTTTGHVNIFLYDLAVSTYVIYFRFMELLTLSTSNTHSGSREQKPPSPPCTPQESFPPPAMIQTLEELFADKNLGPQPGVVACNQQLHHHLHHHHSGHVHMQVI
jgi:hypothetical protein